MSDNVIRCGLTPKYKDIENMLKYLDYRLKKFNYNIYKVFDNNLSGYCHSCNEFMVYLLKINKDDQYLLNVVLNKNYGGIIYVQDG